MTNSNTLPNITNSTVTHMTLKEITDLLEVRHNDAMKIVAKMAENAEFGMITKIPYSYEMPNSGIREMETYQLNKRQSIAVAARLNTNLLMRIIDRWQELEAVTQAIADTIQVNKEDMIKELKQDSTIARLQASIQASKDKTLASQLKLQALKDKLAKQSEILNARTTAILARGAKVKGDMVVGKLDLPTDCITELLKTHGSEIEPKFANWALRKLGYLTSDNKVTALGLPFGKTIKASPKAKTTLARWYVNEFDELLSQITEVYNTEFTI